LPARRRVSGLLLSSVRAEFRAAAPAGAAPLRGDALAVAEATAARTFEARPPREPGCCCVARACLCAATRRAQFLRRALHHGGAERALLQHLVSHADDAVRPSRLSARRHGDAAGLTLARAARQARGVLRPGSLKLRAQRAKLEPAAHRAWAARLAELNAELGVALKDTKIRAQTDTETAP